MRQYRWVAIGMAFLAGTLPLAASAQMGDPVVASKLLSELTGRRNPYVPLIPAMDPNYKSRIPPLPSAPLAVPAAPRPPKPAAPPIRYLGIAYDEQSAVAIVKIGEKYRFLRRGDAFNGGIIQSLTPKSIVILKGGRRTSISRDPGAH